MQAADRPLPFALALVLIANQKQEFEGMILLILTAAYGF